MEVLIKGKTEMLELPGDSYYFAGRHNGHDPLDEGDQTFSLKSSLKNHLEVVHMKLCNICDTAFFTKEEVVQHIKSTHIAYSKIKLP